MDVHQCEVKQANKMETAAAKVQSSNKTSAVDNNTIVDDCRQQ